MKTKDVYTFVDLEQSITRKGTLMGETFIPKKHIVLSSMEFTEEEKTMLGLK